MISVDEFKAQLFEFIEFMEEPFDAKFIYKSCIQPIDIYRVYDVLQQLEDEGKIVSLSDGRYISIRGALRRWLRGRLIEVKIPDYLIRDVEWAAKIRPKQYKSIDAFIADAIRDHIMKIKKRYEEEVRRYG
ncbi:MAG: hypothetical protein QXF59_05630 [Candidatus Bathyarchaeia archaeon]|nr:hypothetical protein [Candidatus Bathyarchaeota archaeon]